MKVTRTRCCGLFLLLLTVPFAVHAAVVYVDIDATGSNNGASWADAYVSLTNALAKSTGEFWVAEGTYYTPTSSGTDIKTNQLYGGFNGTEASLSQRNWTAYPTILDGGGSNRVLQKTVAGTAILDGFTVQKQGIRVRAQHLTYWCCSPIKENQGHSDSR